MAQEIDPGEKDFLYLLRVEGQNFESVIYDTHDLSTIAGGSRLLADVPRAVEMLLDDLKSKKELRDLRTILRAASIGVFIFRTERRAVPGILNQVKESLLKPPLCHLTIHTDAVELPWNESTAGEGEPTASSDDILRTIDAQVLDRLQGSARFAQMRMSNVVCPSVQAGINQACPIDHVRPATGNGESNWSPFTEARRNAGKAFRWHRQDIPTVETFEEMTEYHGNRRRDGRLAVISIDGKGFGKIREELCKSLYDVRWFSDQLKKAQDKVFNDLLSAWTSDRRKNLFFHNFIPDPQDVLRRRAGSLLRLQRLITAGDDGVYLMPAWLAWDFLERFFSADWKLTPETEEQRMGLAGCDNEGLTEQGRLCYRAGIVICSAKAPIHPIRELACELEELGREEAPDIKNPVAYEVLKSFDLIGPKPKLEKYRDKRRAGELGRADLVLEGRDLQSAAKRLKTLQSKYTASQIKNPERWHEIEPGDKIPDAYHLSQWKDYIEWENYTD